MCVYIYIYIYMYIYIYIYIYIHAPAALRDTSVAQWPGARRPVWEDFLLNIFSLCLIFIKYRSRHGSERSTN